MFSVIIPLYNKENNIEKTIRSVISQTFGVFEIIVVNDGSTDGSLTVVKKIPDDRLRIIDIENRGVSNARNVGIKSAKFSWIAFLDADDLWMPNHLETVRGMINSYRTYEVFCTRFVRSNQLLNSPVSGGADIVEDYFYEARNHHFFWTSVAVININVFRQIGVFKEYLTRGEDLDLWARIGEKYPIVRERRVTAVYVQDSDNKLSYKKVSLDQTIVNYIDFKNMSGTKRLYFKTLVFNKIKQSIRRLDIRNALKLLVKYHFRLM